MSFFQILLILRRVFRHVKFGCHFFSYRSLLLSTSVLIDTDVDECTCDTDGCEHNCINTVGSFFCSCDTGYALALDARNCTGKHNAYLKHT